MLPESKIIVTPKKFDALFKKDTHVAELSTPEEEDAYEKRDAFLIHLIKAAIKDHFGADSDTSPHVIEDWWPNHTRYLELLPVHCTATFLHALHELLTDEFSGYRFQACVYENPSDGNSYIGSFALYADRIVIEAKLNDRARFI